MAEVRCPMCGKANPEERETCQYCQARLRPIWEAAPLESASDDDLPEWLRSLRSEPEEEKRKEETLPDWLSGIREVADVEGPLEADQTPAAVDQFSQEQPDISSQWFGGDFAPEEEPAEAGFGSQFEEDLSEESISWLSRIQETDARAGEPAPGGDEAGEDVPQLQHSPFTDELPEWLGQEALEEPSVEQADFALELQPPDREAPEEEQALPEGLSDEMAQEPADRRALPDEEIPSPDWFGGEIPPVQPSKDEFEAEQEAAQPELPDWMTDEEGKLPDWLQSGIFISPLEQPTQASSIVSEPPPDVAETKESELPATDAKLPFKMEEGEPSPLEWLASLEAEAGEVKPGKDLQIPPEIPEDELSWLSELEATYSDLLPEVEIAGDDASGPSEGFESEVLSPPPVEGLPSWLSDTDAESEEAPTPAGEEEDLQPAELPSWLQAMRPLGIPGEATNGVGGVETEQVEGAGPLAGLRGVLPAEPEVSQGAKPSGFPLRLQVTDAQEEQANLLRRLIESEAQPRPLPQAPILPAQFVLRLAMAVLLILPVLLGVVSGLPEFARPAPSSEILTVRQMIERLTPQSPVLFAIDYEPSYSGEMDAVSGAILGHLLRRNVYPVIISTVPTGPIQAERLLSLAGKTVGQTLAPSDLYANLGYLAGGATALAAFVETPRTYLSLDIQGERVWDRPPLQNVNSAAQFAMVVVAVENPDRARTWIEQLSPKLNDTPFVMVISAQAEPLIRPYYDAAPSQVQGLVSGLTGAAAYEAATVQSGAASLYWTPFNIGLLMAVLLMFLGGVINMIAGRIVRQKRRQEIKNK